MEQIRLDLIPGKSAPVCHASQYDVGRTIRLNLVEGGSEYSIPSGTTAEIHIRKPDNNIISAAVTATQGNKYIDIVTAEQWTACAGTNLCEIVLTNGGNVIGTINFILEVEMDPIDGGSASESVIENLQAMVEAAIAASPYPAEVEDIRNGADGDVYLSAGDAVRAQAAVTSNDITNLIIWKAKRAIDSRTGLETSSTNFKCSWYTDTRGASKLKITVPIYTPASGVQTVFGLAFFDETKTYINSGYQIDLGTNANKNIVIDIPTGTKYFRTTYFNDSYTGYTETVEFGTEFIYVGADAIENATKEKNHIVLGQEEINRFYGLKSDGLFDASIWGVTSFIDCHGVDKIRVKMPIRSSSINNVVGLEFLNETKTRVQFIESNAGATNSAEIRIIPVPYSAYYFRCCYWNYDNKDTNGGDWFCEFDTPEYGKFRPYQSDYIFFSPTVNNAQNQYWNDDADTELALDMKDTNSVLLLPDNYDPDGEPVPVIMYFHGLSHYVYYDNWGANADFRTQKAQFAAQGFAVIDCNGARTNNKTGNYTSGGSLQYCDGYHKTFEYVKKHYNVEPYCHVICASAGGIAGINYTYWFNDVKSLLMLSAWTSLRYNSYANNIKDTMIEYLGCDFSDGYDATEDKTIGFDPYLRIIDVDGTKYLPSLKVPAKAMIGSTEANNHIWVRLNDFVGALRNAGQSVSLRVVDGATHKDICSSAILALNTEYANWCKSI